MILKVLSFLLIIFLGWTACGPRLSATIIQNERDLVVQVTYPTIEDSGFNLRLRPIPIYEPQPVSEPMYRLASAISKYRSMNFVPYVWGGQKVGTKEECIACIHCVQNRKPNASVKDIIEEGDRTQSQVQNSELEECEACQKCGIDCSNFAHLVYEEAGLTFKYLTSREMAHKHPRDLLDNYDLLAVGADLKEAAIGDLIVQDSHVVIYLGVDPVSKGAIYIHSSRRGEDFLPFGGINVVWGRPLDNFQKTVRRILRHRHLNGETVYSKDIVSFREQPKPYL